MNSGGSGAWRSRGRREAIPEAHEPSLTRRGINENIRRLHVLVDQPLLVQPAECGCDTDSEAQEPRHLHRPWKESIEKSHRQDLRARASSAQGARRAPGAEPPRPSPVHPSTSIRAPSFLASPTLAASKQELGGERMVNQAGSSARPGTGRTPHRCGELRGHTVKVPR